MNSFWVRFSLFAAIITAVSHVVALQMTGLDPVASPVRLLSTGQWGWIHTNGLMMFGAAHMGLAIGMRGLDEGRLWPYARGLVFAGGVALIATAILFGF